MTLVELLGGAILLDLVIVFLAVYGIYKFVREEE